MFPHVENFSTIKQGIDCIVLGSNNASRFFDKKIGFSSCMADLTVNPSSISYMFQIIKNYHSYLRDNGEIVLILHPMSLCVNHYDVNKCISTDIRFYPILHNALIETYDKRLSEKWSRYQKSISLKDFVSWISISLSRFTYKKEMLMIHKILRNSVFLDGNSKYVLSNNLSNVINENVHVLEEIRTFSEERGYVCKIIVMNNYLNDVVMKQYGSLLDNLFYSPLRKSNISVSHENYN